MGLIDSSTLIASIAATLVVTFGTTLLWMRIFRKGFVNVAVRLSLIFLCQALALVSVGLGVNRANGFFESWSDLFGRGTNYSSVAITNSQLPKLSQKDIRNATPGVNKSIVISDVIRGNASGVSNSVKLYLPGSLKEDLLKKRKPNPERYRVVEFLTGFPSQPSMWFKVMAIDKELARYNAAHPMKQIIGVFPQVNIAGNYDLECMDLPSGKPKAETWLAEDMHTYLAKRLGGFKPHWAVMGLSTGGWCAAMLSMRHPELFDRAISIAGYYRPALPLTDPISLQNWAKSHYDLNQFEVMLPQKLKLYLVASLGDKYSIKETRKFLAIKHPMLDIKYRELAAGGHNPHVWVPSVMPALEWL